jgi:hypothetical protein
MIKQYAKITRSAADGSYIIPLELLEDAINGEKDGNETGESIIVTFIEMDDEEYSKLEEFQGW